MGLMLLAGRRYTSLGRAWYWHLVGRDATKYPSINRVAPSPTQTNNYPQLMLVIKCWRSGSGYRPQQWRWATVLIYIGGRKNENEDALVILDPREWAFRCRTIGIKTVVLKTEVWADYLPGGVKYRRRISKTDHLILLTIKEEPKSLLSCNLFYTLLW